MLTERGPIYFLSGAPGVGKSSTAKALANRFEKSVLIDIDYFRKLVLKGRSEPSANWTDETTRQIELAHIAVGKVAKTYSDAGFAVVAEHCSSPDSIQLFVDQAGPTKIFCLKAEMPTNLERNRNRQGKSFDPADIEHFVLSLGDSMHKEHHHAGINVLDTTNLTSEQTVEAILAGV